MPEPALSLRVMPRASSCRAARERIVAYCHTKGVAQEDIAYLLTAVGEALANAIEHGHSGRPIELTVRVSSDRVVATIRDGGVGFRTEPASATLLPGAEAERGRGLAIMRRCSDMFSIASLPGGGTVVTIGRYLRRHELLGATG